MAKAKRARAAHRGTESARVSLADVLFSKTQQRTLGFLFGQPDRSFYANELITLTGSGSGAIQRELRRLSDSNLVTVTSSGGRTYYRANKHSPLFAELRSITLKTIGLAEPIKRALSALGPSILFAAIYGSVAKGTDSASSDIDLMIVTNDLTLEEAFAAVAPAERELSRRISVTMYTEEEFSSRSSDRASFLARVLAGEHIVLVGRAAHGTATP